MTASDSPAELVLDTGPAANGGSCVARHDGRVVFVRYALPGERVRARVTSQRGSYWHAEAVEVLEASADRIEPLCPIAGVDGAGCCDLAFADPAAVRALKAEVVANQLARLGDYVWQGTAEPLGASGATGWRMRVRLDVDDAGRAGFHRYHSAELVTDLRCAQLPFGMVDGLGGARWQPGGQVHVAIDDNGYRHVVSTSPERRGHGQKTRVVAEGTGAALQRVSGRVWLVPVTAFWQAHRDAAATYSALVTEWARAEPVGRAWDLYGGAGLFAAALAEVWEEVVTVDTSRMSSTAARSGLSDLPGVRLVSDSVRNFLSRESGDGVGIAVVDPPRAGAGREVIDLLARAGVPRIIHIGCEAASFARDIGLYRSNGYHVEALRVFDAFPLTHHVECIALLTSR